MKRFISVILCFAIIMSLGITAFAAEEKTTEKVVDTINVALMSNAVDCIYEDKWVAMFPIGKPDNTSTWPEWDQETCFAEIVTDGHKDPGALHLRSSVYKNVGVTINAGMIPGNTYTIGLWAKGTAQSQTLFSYNNGGYILVETAEALKNEWQYYEVSFTATHSQLTLCCRDWGSNDVYVDNITLKDSDGNNLLGELGDFYRTPRDKSFDANLNFEKRVFGVLANWNHRSVEADGSMKSVTDRVYSGQRAIGVTRQKGKIDVSFITSNVLIPVSPGDSIEVIAHISSRNSVAGHFSMYFETYGKEGASQPFTGCFGQEQILYTGEAWSNWDSYEMTYLVGSGVYYVRIGMRVGGTEADIRIDDLQYYNYTDNGNTVYEEDFDAPSVTTGLPGGWHQTVKNGEGSFDGAMTLSGDGENRLYTELYCLQTGRVYSVNATSHLSGNASGKLLLEAVDYRQNVVALTEIPLTSGSISQSFTAHSAVYYRLWLTKEGSGTLSLEHLSIQKTGDAANTSTNPFQSVSFRFPTGSQMAGQEISVIGTLTLKDTMPAVDTLSVRFARSGKTVCVGKLRIADGKTADQWPVGSSFRADFKLIIPGILPAGSYTVVLDDTGTTIGLISVKRTEKPVSTTSWVETVDGRPTLFVNGQAQVPLWYARPENPDLYESHTVTRFAESGIDTVVSYIFLNNNYGDVWTSSGLATQAIDDMMWATLSGNPDAKLMIAIDLNAPQWWKDANPGELVALEKTVPDRNGASFASEKWKQEAGDIMVQAIDYLMTQPYANNIIGFKITGGYTLEWNWWGLSGNEMDVGDFSPCGISAFRLWLKEKYSSDEALQKAYSDTTVTLETAMPPSVQQRQEASGSSVLTVQDHPQMMDYELFMAQLKADTIESFAALAKDAVDDRLVVGTYGGYFYMGGGYEFSSAVSNVYFQEMLKSPNIDFIKSPWMYGLRESGDSAEFMGPVDSAMLHGKLWIVEEDSRLNLQEMKENQDSKAAVGWTRDYLQSVEQLKRNFSYVLSKGMGMSFYNLIWNFFDDPQYYGVIGQMYGEMAETLSDSKADIADIAVFVDGQSNMLIPYDGNYLNSVLYSSVYQEQLKALGHMGAPYDMYLLDDLRDGLVPEHKINIFLGTTWISPEERAAIAESLQKNGNILVWVFTDGISNGNITDISLMEELTGMDLSIVSTQRRHIGSAVVKNTDHWLTAGVKNGSYYGVETYDKMSPVIAVTDSQAEILGYHVAGADGVTESHGALAVKDMGDWTSVYSAVPNIPQEILRNLISRVGGTIYTDSGSDVIYAGGSHIALHSIFEGTRTVEIPKGYGVYDVFREEEVPVENGAISVTLTHKETRLFRLIEGTSEPMWLDDSLMTGAYTAYPGKWVPMYPTGVPVENSTWPAWNRDTHYGEIVADGCQDLGALHLVSAPYKNTAVAIDAGMTPGQVYTLGLWAKGTSNSGNVLNSYGNGDFGIIGACQELSVDWKYYEVTFTANMAQLNLLSRDWGNTDIYIDNITLKNAVGKDLLDGYGDFWQAEHTWKEATLNAPKTCMGCGLTEGKALSCVDTWNLTLGGDISVNFRVYLEESLSSAVTFRIGVAGKTWDYAPEHLSRDREGFYSITATLAAAQMGDTITVQAVMDGNSFTLGEYTVLQYANTLLADGKMAKYHPLVKAMLCYGGAAQTYFDYQADRLVSSGITPEIVGAIPDPVKKEMVSGSAEGISFYGASLVFQNQIAVRFYFTGNLNEHSLSDGLTAVSKGELWYVEIPGVNPQDLDESFTLIVDGTLSVTYSPMDYMTRMAQKGSPTLKALLEAMYHYYLAAENFFATT